MKISSTNLESIFCNKMQTSIYLCASLSFTVKTRQSNLGSPESDSWILSSDQWMQCNVGTGLGGCCECDSVDPMYLISTTHLRGFSKLLVF